MDRIPFDETRLRANLIAVLNERIEVAILSLSTQGCLVELPSGAAVTTPIRLAFMLDARCFTLDGEQLSTIPENHLGIRFAFTNAAQAEALATGIQQAHRSRARLPAARVSLRTPARLNHQRAVLINLSATGGFVATGRPPARGEIVQLAFAINGTELNLTAQARWCDDRGVGLEFLSPAAEAVQNIVEFIAAHTPAPAR